MFFNISTGKVVILIKTKNFMNYFIDSLTYQLFNTYMFYLDHFLFLPIETG